MREFFTELLTAFGVVTLLVGLWAWVMAWSESLVSYVLQPAEEMRLSLLVNTFPASDRVFLAISESRVAVGTEILRLSHSFEQKRFYGGNAQFSGNLDMTNAAGRLMIVTIEFFRFTI